MVSSSKNRHYFPVAKQGIEPGGFVGIHFDKAIVDAQSRQGGQDVLDQHHLPGPLPERLVSQREAIRARILMLQGHNEDGLAVLRARLEDEPGDAFALGVLLESFHVRHVPEPAEMVYWLKGARRHVMDPALAQEMENTLAAIAEAAKEPPAPAPAPPP